MTRYSLQRPNAPGKIRHMPPTRSRSGRGIPAVIIAQAACGVGAAYAAVSVYWALGGTWLLDTVGGTLEQQGRAGNPGIMLAVWAAAVLKIIGAIVPLAAVGMIPGRHPSREGAWCGRWHGSRPRY
jgi:hypothetical protein